MPLTLDWTDIALRLALTILAGAVLGFDRSAADCSIATWSVSYAKSEPSPYRTVSAELRWRGRQSDVKSPEFVHQMAQREGVREVEWKM